MKKILISLLTVLMMVGTPIVLNVDSFIRIQNVYATVKINKKTVRVLKGKTITLKITGTKKKVIWSSNKKSIATVNSKGVVTGKKKGTATITAKVGNKKYTCKVTVEVPVLNKTSITIYTGKSYQLKLNGTQQKITWSSSNKSIATVNSKGKITAKKVGTTYVKAKVQGKVYSCKINIIKDVTYSIKKDNNLNKVINRLNSYCVAESANKPQTKNTEIKLSNKNMISIASYVRYNFNNDETFTKNELVNTVKLLFGKSITNIELGNWIRKAVSYDYTSDPYVYAGGDWGNYCAKYNILKIIETSNNVYKITIDGNMYCYETGKMKKICTVNLYIKKSSQSSYGYIVTKCNYKGTGVGYF